MARVPYCMTMVNTKHITYGAIVGLDGACWENTHSSDLKISNGEAKILISAFNDATPLHTNGLVLAGVKYVALACDTKVLHGKKGTGGIVIVKTNKAMVIGVYAPDLGIDAGTASDVVQKFAARLHQTGF